MMKEKVISHTGSFFKNRLVVRFQLANTLCFHKLQNGNRRYAIIGMEYEQDAADPALKVCSIIFLGLSISFIFA